MCPAAYQTVKNLRSLTSNTGASHIRRPTCGTCKTAKLCYPGASKVHYKKFSHHFASVWLQLSPGHSCSASKARLEPMTWHSILELTHAAFLFPGSPQAGKAEANPCWNSQHDWRSKSAWTSTPSITSKQSDFSGRQHQANVSSRRLTTHAHASLLCQHVRGGSFYDDSHGFDSFNWSTS